MNYSSTMYSFLLEGRIGNDVFRESGEVSGDATEIDFEPLKIKIIRAIKPYGSGFTESVTIRNYGSREVYLDDIRLGYLLPLCDGTLYAIPFPIQQDGRRHIYSSDVLMNGIQVEYVNNNVPVLDKPTYGNSVYSDPSRPEPKLTEKGLLRSEAWYWETAEMGLLVAKYNGIDIEYSMVEPLQERGLIRIGGVSFCLYHEPRAAELLRANSSFTFGETYYVQAEGIVAACGDYKKILNEHGHGLPADYSPKVHWNELYDIGWFHSDRTQLNRYYTLETLKGEADKAKKCSCDALYLDPGWEFAEGLTFFDHHRIGEQKDFVKLLKSKYGLDLSIRTILRTYINYWPSELNVLHDRDGISTASMTPKTIIPANQLLYEQCLCNRKFFNEKKRRIEKLVEDGASFIMFDEMDWRGECVHPNHSHTEPATASDHANAVCDLAKHIKNKYGITVEVHDPVWPWNSAVYTPVYWRQGFGEEGSYQENWGFEFMWECINDLQTGRALSLYYYNLSCDIPLYLHINMSADNDNCLFFWWAASTVRHLGIGGAYCHSSVLPEGVRFEFNPEVRFNSYVECMKNYKKLAAYYQRGKFTGVNEYVHLHTLNGRSGGVLDFFNCENTDRKMTATISFSDLNADATISCSCDAVNIGNGIKVELELPALSHKQVLFGEAMQAV